MRLAAVFFVLLSSLILAAAALAHPHIFARYRVVIAPGDAGYINLHFTFTFQGVPNPVLTPGAQAADRQQLKQDMLANLTEHPFYLYLDMDGQSVGRQTVRPTPVSGSGKAYAFDLAVPAMVKNFSFALYDPAYFVFVQQNDTESVRNDVTGMPCTTEEREVGKTVWGVLRAQSVVCGDRKNGQPPSANLKMQPPGENPESRAEGIKGRALVP